MMGQADIDDEGEKEVAGGDHPYHPYYLFKIFSNIHSNIRWRKM